MSILTLNKFQYRVKNYREGILLILCKIFSILNNHEDQENEVEEEETIVQPKNTDVQNALDLLLRAAIFSNQLGEKMQKYALTW